MMIFLQATEACLLVSLVDGYDRLDPEYVDDFLLLFRVFMTYDQRERDLRLPPGMITLCLALLRWLDQVNYRDKVVKIVLNWLSSYYHDFELNPDYSYLFFKVFEKRLLDLSMYNQLHLLRVTLSTKSKIRQVTITRSSREQPLIFAISGGYEKNCGIFVSQVHGLNNSDNHYENYINYIRYPNWSLDGLKGPTVPPRHRANQGFPYPQEAKNLTSLRPGDQILELNGTNFSAIKLVEAQKKLDLSTHLCLTVKYNPFAFHEMKLLPEGKRKSSLSSMSSVSPYQPANIQRFTFNSQDSACNNFKDQHPPPSPLFSNNSNFDFASIIRPSMRNDRSKLSSLIHSSRQFVKNMVDSKMQAAINSNFETMSKTSDNISDEVDLNKAKSSTDLPTLKNKIDEIDSGLLNIMRHDDTKTDLTNGENVLRVFNAANNDSRYLLIHEDTTAREVVMVAVKEFNLTANPLSPDDKSVSSLNWHLYEVSVVPESKTIKQKCLSEQTNKLAERASLCSRFYIKNNSQTSQGSTRLDMGDDALVNDILRESPPNIKLSSFNPTLLAVELTLADFDKFKSIEPQQFVYDTFFDYSEKNNINSVPSTSSADSASLKSSSSDGHDADLLHAINKSRMIPKKWMQEYQEFADISNKEMFWVVCEILNEPDIDRRVRIIKQFVRVAEDCYRLRNYNSMFAIISGLGHSCVNRLKKTFEKLHSDYKKQLDDLRGLFDPSKNMSIYRSCLNGTEPPAIPLFPQIKKDLTFTKEGRSIFVKESNNDVSDGEEFGDFSQDTIKRKSRDNLMSNSVKSSASISDAIPQSTLNQMQTTTSRSISYTNFNTNRQMPPNSDNDSILINFSEVRQFTDRVRNVIHYSSIPYSNDLVTNTKDTQRNKAQLKEMHKEWHMRKRIRHYLKQILDSVAINQQQNMQSIEKLDQVDGPTLKNNVGRSGKLNITYDEKILYQRSIDIEPELNNNRPKPALANSISERQFQTTIQNSNQSQLPQLPPLAMNMHMPPTAANSSPTLSKSSSLSSCSSFNNHHLPNFNVPRGNLTSSVGKFGTESTESLRKLRALSENVDDWKPYHGNGNGNSANNASKGINCTTNRIGSDLTSRLVPTKMFPPKRQ